MPQPSKNRPREFASHSGLELASRPCGQPRIDTNWGPAVELSDVAPAELTRLEDEKNSVVEQHRQAQDRHKQEGGRIRVLTMCRDYENATPELREEFGSLEERFGTSRVAWAQDEKEKHGSWVAAIEFYRPAALQANMESCATSRGVVREVRKRRAIVTLRIRRPTPRVARPRRSGPAIAIVSRTRRSIRCSFATSKARDGTDSAGDSDPPHPSWACDRPLGRLSGGAPWR